MRHYTVERMAAINLRMRLFYIANLSKILWESDASFSGLVQVKTSGQRAGANEPISIGACDSNAMF